MTSATATIAADGNAIFAGGGAGVIGGKAAPLHLMHGANISTAPPGAADVLKGARGLGEMLTVFIFYTVLPLLGGMALLVLSTRRHYAQVGPFLSSTVSIVRAAASAKSRTCLVLLGVLLTPIASTLAKILALRPPAPKCLYECGGGGGGEGAAFCHSVLFSPPSKLEQALDIVSTDELRHHVCCFWMHVVPELVQFLWLDKETIKSHVEDRVHH